jgi:hypothetical protein
VAIDLDTASCPRQLTRTNNSSRNPRFGVEKRGVATLQCPAVCRFSRDVSTSNFLSPFPLNGRARSGASWPPEQVAMEVIGGERG